MVLQAFLQVGLSFADVGLFEGQTLKSHRRLYLPQEPLGSSLKKFWAEQGVPQKLVVSSRFLEKILDAKLGGTVAQIVTSGFETWPILRQPVLPDRFDTQPFRQEPLASQELIFGLSERISKDGQILKPLEISELEFINSKLQLMTVKRVCVNLLFANVNASHQDQVARYFREQGFEVFAAPRASDSTDEMPAWRKNVMNACLVGAFGEHIEEIQKSFPEESVPSLHFVDQAGNQFLGDKNQIAGSLFAWAHALQKNLAPQADQVLYLGLENWYLISGQEKMPFWPSPWGFIEVQAPRMQKLRMQPTLEISSGFWGGIHFSKNELGFEPGPMCFGRALKPTAFDLINEIFPTHLAQIQPQGSQKLRDQFNALIKNVPELRNWTVESLIKTMTDHLMTLVAMECQVKSGIQTGKTLVTGLFAPRFYSDLKKKWFDSELVLDPLADKRELMALKGLEVLS